jgi:Tfp pilus assembly protein PilF
MFPLMCNISFGQNKAEAEKLVDEGVAYHDKGDYDGAISKYDKALELDKDNLLALTEKAFSLLSLQKYDEAIKYCQKALETHSGDKGLKTVYVTYGNAYDGLKKTDKSIEMYDHGIKQFPDYYQLYFNKGITLSSVKKYDEAILCFQKSVTLNPKHGSSHNAIARLSNIINNRIPSLLAYCRFLSIEPQSNRAKENLASLQRIMKGNVEETGKNSVTINISSDMLNDTTAKSKENSFASTDLILAMDAALDFDKKNKKKTEVEQFIRKFETVCATLKETQKDNYGFYWDYYAPYFIEMKDKNFIETFSYIAFASFNDPEVSKWLKSHKSEIDKFFEWSTSFEWKAN